LSRQVRAFRVSAPDSLLWRQQYRVSFQRTPVTQAARAP
jgi:hypothetical protein